MRARLEWGRVLRVEEMGAEVEAMSERTRGRRKIWMRGLEGGVRGREGVKERERACERERGVRKRVGRERQLVEASTKMGKDGNGVEIDADEQ